MNLPCEIVRDLLPSYADGLTCETTNDALRAHLDICAACRDALSAMRAPEAAPLPEPDRKELDFLKKTRRRNRRIVLSSLLAALALAVGLLAIRVFVVGGSIYLDALAARASVDGQQVTLDVASTDSARAITNVSFREEDGVVTATVRAGLPSFLHRGDARAVYEAAGPVRTVMLDERILWQEGSPISPQAAKLFESRHDYVGDMSANSRSAGAAGLSEKLGPYTSELDTESRPYVWHIRLEQTFLRSDDLAYVHGEMRRIAFALLAVIGNLDAVQFEFDTVAADADVAMNGEGEIASVVGTPAPSGEADPDTAREVYTVTVADATAYLGRDVKDCMNDVRLLDELI